MKSFRDMKDEQREFCAELESKAFKLVQSFQRESNIGAVLLTGSVARGDARKGPYGVLVDLLLILNHSSMDFEPVFGPDLEPEIPFYCGKVDGVDYQIQSVQKSDFLKLPKPEDQLYALCESKILLCNDDEIDTFIGENFKPFGMPRKDLAMQNFYRFHYLTNDYRLEKWLYREAFLQISENYHSSLICFAHFLYAINKSFIPRDDWKIYLLFDLALKPDNLEEIIESLQSGVRNHEDIKRVQDIIKNCENWMSERINEAFGS